MTTRNTEHPSSPRPRGVLDAAWEHELRSGQEADGGAGSIEPELAVLRLLRHARAPEALAPADLDRLWSEGLAPALAPTPWYRRKWLWGGLPAVAAAAVVIVIVRGPGQRSDEAGEARVAQRAAAPAAVAAASPAAMSQVLAQQFAQLEPEARRGLGESVDGERSLLRQELLAMSHGAKP